MIPFENAETSHLRLYSEQSKFGQHPVLLDGNPLALYFCPKK